MVAFPFCKLAASPALLTVAADVADEVQVTLAVRFCVLPSLYVPVAVNCCVSPAATEAALGLTAIEISTGAVTVNPAVPLIVPAVAVTVVAPCVTPVATPLLLTIATPVVDEVHCTVPLRF
jgi:hypothetical protein